VKFVTVLPIEHARASALAALRLASTRQIAGSHYEMLVARAVEVGCAADDVAAATEMPVEQVRSIASRRRRRT
jgi:hypothetical protein